MTETLFWLGTLQVVAIGLIGWALQKITTIDAKVSKHGEWQRAHEKSDDERHLGLSKTLERLWHRVDDKRDQDDC